MVLEKKVNMRSLSEEEYYHKVYGCWLGKNCGARWELHWKVYGERREWTGKKRETLSFEIPIAP